MNRGRDLAKNTIIIAIGTICTKLLTFLLLPLYTSILTTEEYGIVDLFMTIVSLAVPIMSLQIEQGVFRFLIDSRKEEKKKREVISTGILFTVASAFVYLLIFLAVSPFIHNEYKYFLATNAVACVLSTMLLQISRGIGENKEYSAAGIITAVVTIACNVLFLVSIHLRVDGMLLGTLAGYLVGIVYLFLRLKIYKLFSVHYCTKKTLKRLIRYSVPLVPNQLSWWVFNTSDRVIVSLMLGLASNGVLSVSYKFSSIIIIIYNIFHMSWTESVALHINDGDIEKYFNNVFNKILYVFVSLGFCTIAFMPIIFKILVNDNYTDAYYLIPIPILAAVFQVVVGLISVVYIAKNNTKAIANTSIISAIINIVVHLLLIRWIGLYAAVVSTLASYLVFAIYRTHDVSKKYFKIRYDARKVFLIAVLGAGILVCYYNKSIYMSIAMMVLSVASAIYLNAGSMKQIYKKLRRKYV